MARFYVTASGGRGETSRTGNSNSGIHAHARGWSAGVEVFGGAADSGEDVFHIYMTTGSNPSAAPVHIGTVRSDDAGNGKPVFTPANRGV